MEVIYLTHSKKPVVCEPHVMALGFFDGVHLGHQKLLKEAEKRAQEKGCRFSVMTFSPHPDEVIKKDEGRQYLMTLPQKIKKMEKLGVDILFIAKFDMNLASLQPTAFIEGFIEELNVLHVVVGFDFTFGFKARGDVGFLQRTSRDRRWGVSVIAKECRSGQKVSSTLVRDLVRRGEVSSVRHYTGEDYRTMAVISDSHGGNRYSIEPRMKTILPSQGSYDIRIETDKKVYTGCLECAENAKVLRLTTALPIIDTKDECEIIFLKKAGDIKNISVRPMEEIVYG